MGLSSRPRVARALHGVAAQSGRRRALAPFIAAFCALAALHPSAASATPGMHTLRLEGAGALMLTDPQTSRFDFGGGFAAGYELRPVPYLGVELRFSAFFFPSTAAAPTIDGYGAFYAPSLGLRAHPLPDLELGDLWIGAAGDLVVTGDVVRPGLEIGAGFEFEATWWLKLGPFVRYVHTFELDTQAGASSAGFLELGVSVALLGEEPAQQQDAEPAPDGDPDRDGLREPADRCPEEPEDPDGFQDEDGCPDPDNDGDGILDVDDRCPRLIEDRDGFEDADGCPDTDNDRDQIFDVDDRCPLEAEDRDGFQDTDGCPDPDNDRDSILDAADRCPLDPGQPDTAHPERHGCPQLINVDRDRSQIVILRPVEFATNSDRILASSQPTLDELVAALAANPELIVRVEGHTDDRGPDARNLELARQRARSVIRNLAERGIALERLTGWGCGELHPLEPNRTPAGRQTNRRVEFHIVSPPPAGGARHLPGCVEVTRAEAAAQERAAPPRRRSRR